jgi:hypothetical protein
MNPRAFIGTTACLLYVIAIVTSALYFGRAVAGVTVIGAIIVAAAWTLPGMLIKQDSSCAPDETPQDAADK